MKEKGLKFRFMDPKLTSKCDEKLLPNGTTSNASFIVDKLGGFMVTST